MKVKYLQQTTLLVSPKELYDLGIGIKGKLVFVHNQYHRYLGCRYHWVEEGRTYALRGTTGEAGWWGYSGGNWLSTYEILFEVEV